MSSSSEGVDLSDEFPPAGISIARFSEHVRELQSTDFDEESGLVIEFQRLESYSALAGKQEEFQSANETKNKTKNRYANVLPPEKTRVRLVESTDSTADYINANYIRNLDGERKYIASQGPLKQTVNDFWKMAWDENVDVIVMLTRVKEKGRLKCYEYWPVDSEEYETFTVTLDKQNDDDAVIIRNFTVKNNKTKEIRKITHFQYIEWPDFGLPSSTIKFREMLHGVDESHKVDAPLLVHCSAGIGRTGTFCALHSIFQYLKQKGYNEDCTINLPEVVLRMREERTGMVQTRAQYEFCYIAIVKELENVLSAKNLSSSQDD